MFTAGPEVCCQGKVFRSVLRSESNIHVAITRVKKDGPYAQRLFLSISSSTA